VQAVFRVDEGVTIRSVLGDDPSPSGHSRVDAYPHRALTMLGRNEPVAEIDYYSKRADGLNPPRPARAMEPLPPITTAPESRPGTDGLTLRRCRPAHRAGAAAMIDRLVHHAEVVALKGDSYRLRKRDPAASPQP
jgi:hypothetical protein